MYKLFPTCPQVLLSHYSWLPRADFGEAHVSETLREVHHLHGGLCRDSQPRHHCTPRERVPPKVWVDIFCALPQASTLTSHRQFKVVFIHVTEHDRSGLAYYGCGLNILLLVYIYMHVHKSHSTCTVDRDIFTGKIIRL